MRNLTTSILTLGMLLATTMSPGAAAEPTAIDRRMVLTIDDLPAQRAPGIPDVQIEKIMRSLVATLVEQQVPALGLVNEVKLYLDGQVVPERVALLRHWLEAGLELGNHTYSHPDLHRTPLPEFVADLSRGEEVSRSLSEAAQRPYRFFRHPFLHTGRDLETRRALEATLDRLGYRVAPVTVDNSEWILSLIHI